MSNSEAFAIPSGYISMYLHKDGKYDIKSNSFSTETQIVREEHFKNLIVGSASVLMASRMAPGKQTGSSEDFLNGSFLEKGFQYLEVGTGSKPESVGVSALKNPLKRSTFSNWSFLDKDGNSTSSKTNVLKLVTVFDENEANGALTEMGLFGGDANSSNGSGYLFNYKTFSPWNKTSSTKLTIIWKITF